MVTVTEAPPRPRPVVAKIREALASFTPEVQQEDSDPGSFPFFEQGSCRFCAAGWLVDVATEGGLQERYKGGEDRWTMVHEVLLLAYGVDSRHASELFSASDNAVDHVDRKQRLEELLVKWESEEASNG